MNAKKIFKAILGVGTLVGTAYVAYKTGYQDGKEHHVQELLDDDDFDTCDSEETDFLDEIQETSHFKPLNEIYIEGISVMQLKQALSAICQKKYIHNKILRENLGVDDDKADKILDAFERAGYVSGKNNYSGRKVFVTESDYQNMCC